MQQIISDKNKLVININFFPCLLEDHLTLKNIFLKLNAPRKMTLLQEAQFFCDKAFNHRNQQRVYADCQKGTHV